MGSTYMADGSVHRSGVGQERGPDAEAVKRNEARTVALQSACEQALEERLLTVSRSFLYGGKAEAEKDWLVGVLRNALAL